VYNPEAEIVPTVAFPPRMEFTLQVTAVFEEPLTVAMNCLVAETGTPALAGATLTVAGAAAVTLRLTGELVVPPSPLFVTVTATCIPICAAVAVPDAFRPVGESSVVASATPPKLTTEFAPKFAPLSEIVKGPTGTDVGEVLHNSTGGWVIVMVTAPNLLASAVLVACTVTTLAIGTVMGALKRPLVETVPKLEFPPMTPFTDQLTVVTAKGTYAVNCLVVPMARLPLL